LTGTVPETVSIWATGSNLEPLTARAMAGSRRSAEARAEVLVSEWRLLFMERVVS
jgi:hypothetical protein